MAILFPNHELNLVPGVSAPVTVHVSQGDTGRTITFYLVNGTEKFPIPVTGITATVHGIRKDGAGFGPYPCTIGDGKVSFALQESMTAVAGPAMAEITLADADESVGSANFAIMVEDAVFPQGVSYDNDTSVYEEILRYVQQVAADATEIKGNVVGAVGDLLPGVVANSIGGVVAAQLPYQVETRIGGTVADQLDAVVSTQLSDTVAEEIGPAAASWLENNVDPSGSAGVVDTTLTVSGTAADAKTTGDLIREIEADLGNAHGVLMDLYDLFGWQVGNLINGGVIAYEKYGIVTKNILQFDDDVLVRINEYREDGQPLMASQTAKYNAAGTLISQGRNVGDYLLIRKGERVRIVLYRYDPDQQAIITTALANVAAFPYRMEAHRADQLWHYREGVDIAKTAPFVTGACTVLDSLDNYNYWSPPRSANFSYNTLIGTTFDEDLVVCLSDGVSFGAYAQETSTAVATKAVAAGEKSYCIVPAGIKVRLYVSTYPQDQTVVYDKGSTLADSPLADKVQIYKKSVFGEIKKLISNAYPPEVVSRSIDMTSTDKVYVYVGAEDGWVHGAWYYYTDSWQLGGVYSALTVDTDATLSLPGRAGDAKAIGDALATKLSGTDTTLTVSGTAADAKATGDAITAANATTDSVLSMIGSQYAALITTPGGIYASNGNDYNTSTILGAYKRTDYIPLKKGDKLHVNGLTGVTSQALVAVYSTAKAYDSTNSLAGIGTSTPRNAIFVMPYDGYVRFCSTNSSLASVSVQNVTGKKEYKLLVLGNSFSQDTFAYVPVILQEILPDYLLTFGVAYTSSASISKHIEQYTNNTAYTWFNYWRPTSSAWTRYAGGGTNEKKLTDILAMEKWDAIYVQPTGTILTDADIKTSVVTPGRAFLRILQQIVDHPFVYLMGQWLASSDETFVLMTARMDYIRQSIGVNRIFPIGTGLQNARSNSTLQALGDDGNMLYDGAHQQSGLPALISAYVACLSILDLLGEDRASIYNATFLPTTANCIAINAYKEAGMVSPLPMTHGSSVGATAEYVRAAQEIAVLAINNPARVCDCSEILS